MWLDLAQTVEKRPMTFSDRGRAIEGHRLIVQTMVGEYDEQLAGDL
jgi:hypothetical protein